MPDFKFDTKARINTKLLVGLLIFLLAPSFVSNALADTGMEPLEKQFNFSVFLDSKEIGYHQVNIKPTVDGEQVKVEAMFKVKILFFSAYSYLHSANEIWKDKCLKSISTETIENGDETFVRSEATLDGLAITNNQAKTLLSGCVRSFAYWDRSRLNSASLLNAQSGEQVPAKFSFLGEVEYENESKRIPAKKYLLEAEGSKIRLWYGLDDEWLALKTNLKGGRELAYHRIKLTGASRKNLSK